MTALIRTVYQMDADNVKLKVQGFTGTAVKNTTTDIDWKFPESRYLTGGILSVKNGHIGDKLSIQIIDKDNVMGYGANVVLDEFVTDFYINDMVTRQVDLDCPYVALIPANVYLRVKYVNTNVDQDSTVILNIYSHIPRQ